LFLDDADGRSAFAREGLGPGGLGVEGFFLFFLRRGDAAVGPDLVEGSIEYDVARSIILRVSRSSLQARLAQARTSRAFDGRSTGE
jgi:hypothetical protein